jgi:stalled ribosome rescue protein Dom34
MTTHNKKQFGVWMDTHQATIAVKASPQSSEFVILGHVQNPVAPGNSNENAANNQEMAATQKFFKEIAAVMPNIDEVHVTGTGQVQEQFIHFLAATPQYKNAVATHSTSLRMGDAQLAAFFGRHFH